MGPVIVGFLLIWLGWWLRWFAMRKLKEVGLSDIDFNHLGVPPSYATTGPYAVVDHPCYLGSMMMCAGMGMIALGWAGAVLFVPTVPFYENRMRFEIRMRKIAKGQGVRGA